MEKLTGGFTLPAQAGMDKEVKFLTEKWGVDAFRDSDGTVLSDEILEMGYDIYSTLCLIRADQEYNKANPQECQQKFLISEKTTCTEEGDLVIDVMKGYLRDQFKPDLDNDPKKYWQVFDRTTGEEVALDQWEIIDGDVVKVAIKSPIKYHVYTVNFLVYQIWESTSMYNHITNNWTSEHQSGVDPHKPKTHDHLLNYLDRWIDEHPNTDYVRFTSMMYQFTLIKDEEKRNKFLDWQCFMDTISPYALDEFEKEYGYKLTSEDLINQGYYSGCYCVPSQKLLDWMDFKTKFVRGFTKQCVKQVHAKGRKAVFFFCDHWIGTEPYKPDFDEMNFDGIIGPCLSGVELRRITDVPGNMFTEVRLYPYFFEVDLQDRPVFKDDGDPVAACKHWWKSIRRALLRACPDRIGFGGYLELAMAYPDFLDYVAVLADEFRMVKEKSKQTTPYSIGDKKVVMLDVWGKARAWMHNENWPAGHVPEVLSGIPADVDFINFDDIRNGILDEVGCIINWGQANSSWSGGENWIDEEIITKIREFVANGGGFIGIDAPSACEHQGSFFQLADVLGVEREVGNTAAWAKNIQPDVSKDHFILADMTHEVDFDVQSKVYLANESAVLLGGTGDAVQMAANTFGKGKAVYLSEFNLTPEHNRLFWRAVVWTMGLEEEALTKWATSNICTDCAFYPETNQFVVMNNTEEPQTSTVFNGEGKSVELSFESLEMKWFTADELDDICK